MSASLRSVGLLDVVSTTSAEPSVARLASTPVSTASRRTLARNAGSVASVAERNPPASPSGTGRGNALRCVAIAILALAWTTAHPRSLNAHAVHDPQDDILESIGVDENLGGAVPLDAVFRNQNGEEVRLGDYVRGGPALLTLNYYTCP
ncbi:MAG: hypothetical protein JJE32_06900, partial [Deltaproteobacteria bacterium]|nr:hypothetical protein [Deltaproteobacteria bacterium]